MRTSVTLTGGLCAALLIAGCATTAATVTTSTTTPGATTVPAAARTMTAEQIVAAMQREGFKITGAVTAFTAATDTDHLLGRAGGYTSKVGWALPDDSLESVEVYPTTAEATKRVTYLSAFSGGLMGDGYDYQSGGAILRLSTDLTPAQAASVRTYFLQALEV